MKDLINNLANKAGDQGDFVVWLLEEKLRNNPPIWHPNLTNDQINFLSRHNIKFKYRTDIHEWEIEL